VDVIHCDLVYVSTGVCIWMCGCECCVWINYVDVNVNVLCMDELCGCKCECECVVYG
jgi:hypothetical protein